MTNEHSISDNLFHTGVYAEVVIPLALPMNYTWMVPARLMDAVQVGVRVEVNLGKNKKYAGVVKRIHQEAPEFFEPKEILNVLDAVPVVNEQQLQLWQWMATYYMCTEGEVMAAALPAHFKLSSETILVFNEEAGDDLLHLSNDEYVVAEALQIKKELKITEVQEILDVHNVYPVINSLIHKRICFVWEALKETYAPKRETYVLLHARYLKEEELATLLNEDKRLQRAEKQLELLLSYLHLSKNNTEAVKKSALLQKSNASDAQLKGLVDKGILYTEKRHVDRIQFTGKSHDINFELSDAQQKALAELQINLQDKQVCLLHGVTASGKTEIYIRLIEAYVRQGKQVLYMLPEIALTAQTIRRLQKYFGASIGVYHSKFSQNERVEIWNKVKQQKLQIVLGARSSMFLPFENLGLIICDEEHDNSYKQVDPAPRYHARDAAIYLASLFQDTKIVLGSATPSLETYFNTRQNKYGYVSLTERFGGVQMPPIDIIDTKKLFLKDEEERMITPVLKKAMDEILASKKQIILFQNRRGYTPYQKCNACGWVPQCKYCNVSLTYHKFHNKLSCHYCGSQYAPMHTCMACGSHDFAQKKYGTERVEELLVTLFPQAKIARMDIDTVRGKYAHDQLIQQFEQHQVDILVGTQMLVKGLDFANVDLVGVLDADGILSFADFRVNERAFQLIEQVSGRTGRKNNTGRVLIQSSQPYHPVLQQVMAHQYKAMYDKEIAARETFFYPPFSRIIKLTFKHAVKEVVNDGAVIFANALRNKYDAYLVGPSEPPVNRIRNQYLVSLLIKLPRQQKILQQCKKDILEQVALIHQEKRYKSLIVIPDVDAI